MFYLVESAAAEIDVTAYRINKDKELEKSDILKLREIDSDPLDGQKDSNFSAGEGNHNFIKDRLRHLELELSSVLTSLRSKSTMDEQEVGNCNTVLFLYVSFSVLIHAYVLTTS